MTALDLIEEWKEETQEHFKKMNEDPDYKKNYEEKPVNFLKEKLIKFATYHVDLALQNVSSNYQLEFTPHDQESFTQRSITREDIINFYEDGTDDSQFGYDQLINRDGFTIDVDHYSIMSSYPNILIV